MPKIETVVALGVDLDLNLVVEVAFDPCLICSVTCFVRCGYVGLLLGRRNETMYKICFLLA